MNFSLSAPRDRAPLTPCKCIECDNRAVTTRVVENLSIALCGGCAEEYDACVEEENDSETEENVS